MKKAAIYIRVSTRFQVDKDSLSTQKRDLVAYCDLVLGIQDYEIFEDPGYSAKNTDRPAYQHMMARIRKREFTHLVVWKIDRISRNILDFANMYAELKELDVAFVSKNEQFDTSIAIGEAMLKIILVFAELERKMTAERVLAVLLSRAANGQKNGGAMPLGYSYDKTTDTISVKEDEAAVYQTIVQTYLRTKSATATARYLNDNGILTKNGCKWIPISVNQILRNEFYTGTYVWNIKQGGKKEKDPAEVIRVPDHHPALISREDFERIKSIRAINKRGIFKKGDSYERFSVNALAGLMECDKCGGNFCVAMCRLGKGQIVNTWYICTRRRDGGRCDNISITDHQAGQFIFQLVANILALQKRCNRKTNVDTAVDTLSFRLPDRVTRESAADLLAHIKASAKNVNYKPEDFFSDCGERKSQENLLNSQRAKAEAQLKRLQNLYIRGNELMTEAEYIRELERIMGELKTIEKELADIAAASTGNEPELSEKKTLTWIAIVAMLNKPDAIDYVRLFSVSDVRIIKHFMNTVLGRVYVLSRRITRVTLKNGLTLTFEDPS